MLGSTALMKIGLRSSAGTMMRWHASATSERSSICWLNLTGAPW